MQVVIPKSASAVIPSQRDYIIMHQDKHHENETTTKALEATPHSLLDCLSHYSDTSPSKDVISYLNTSGNQPPSISSSWSFSQLNAATNYLAFRLLDTSKNRLSPVNLTPGDRVLLVYPPCSPHFLISFLACLRAGLIAVPTYPPHPSRKESLSSFTGIATSCDAKVALTNGDFATFKRLNEMKDAFRNKFKKSWPEQLKWVVTDNEPLKNPPSHDNISQQPSLDSIAFLQYTSGSTSEPKGVSITHANLAHNLAIITKELQASPSTVVVSWLPQYHDMGLIGSLLGILYCGGRGYYMSPVAFLARPMAWIEAVSKYRGSHLQAPNFAFGLTARKFDPSEYSYRESGDKTKRMLDLTCLKHIINGAEPVTQTSIEAFERVFRPFGLPHPSVIYPTYGLAEHTVFVCSGGRGSLTVKRKELEEENNVVIVQGDDSVDPTAKLLGCGFPSAQNVDVRIVDPDRRIVLEEDTVGEIWINSPSKAMGYFGRDDITKSEFHAVLNSDTVVQEKSIESSSMSPSTGGYLRSGDLGFFHNKELYICGRLKDLIIIGGRNYYPQDLEATAESSSNNIRPGCSAAFSIPSTDANKEGEDVILLLELKDPPSKAKELKSVCNAITATIRSEISKEFSLSLSCIIILKARSVPKTTSGKISRSRAKRAFLSGNLEELFRSNFNGEIERTIPSISPATASNSVETKKSTPVIAAPISPPSNISSLDQMETRALLLNAICQIANIEKSLVTDTSPLNTFMDSVSLAQLKGMLEGQYGVKSLSDEYLFRDTTTLNKLTEIVKVGEARDDVSTSAADDAGHVQNTPTAGLGQSEGVAGALGCPPGVVCCTIM